MSRATAQQYEFASGQTGLLHKAGVKPSQFEVECYRLNIDPEDIKAQLQNATLLSWVKQNRDNRYVPTALLSRMNLQTAYDGKDLTQYSLALAEAA